MGSSEVPAATLLVVSSVRGVILRNLFKVKLGLKMPETERVDSLAGE